MNINKRKYKILVAAIHYPIASGRYIARALRRMGHDVKTVGPAMGRQVWGVELPEGTEWVPDVLHAEWTPDLIITADSKQPIVWGQRYSPHVVYGVDNHVRDYQHGVEYDHLFLAHSNGHRMGEESVTHLPCGYDPEWHMVTTPLQKRPYHAGMLGVVYKERAAILNRLGEEFRVLAGTGAIMGQYRDAYNQCLTSIVKSVRQDMAQRVFETAAMGCVVIADPVPDFEVLGFEAGVHYLPATTPDEYAAQVRRVIDWPVERTQEMVDAALAWVKPHTWDARCRVILDTVFGGAS